MGTGQPRTMKSLKTQLQEWKDAGAQHKDAKEFGNVVFDSMLEGDDEDMVLDSLLPPELHLLLGVMKLLVNGISLIKLQK